MNICLIGSGGREAALAWKMHQSPACEKLFIIPGNGGTGAFGQNVHLNLDDFRAFKHFLLEQKIQLLVIGPEAPLVDGLVDRLHQDASLDHLRVIGPDREGALLEGSKTFAKEFMREYGIPTAAYRSFTESEKEEACQFLRTMKAPYVLKADGLAAGKGVLIPATLEEAENQTRTLLEGQFGDASKSIVIEEFLKGIEFSVFVLTDGKQYQLLPVAKDYKRRGEGDSGLNTGGMGAVSPVPFVDDLLMQKVKERIIEPTLHGLQARQIDYKGFIFFGLIKVADEPFVIEYNCRLGDPETEVVIPRIKNDLVELFLAVFEGNLGQKEMLTNPMSAATIMLVSDGYPGSYENGKKITGIDQVTESLVFHAGTRLENGTWQTNGGRVLAITSLDKDKDAALAKSRSSIEKIHFDGMQYRKDIGFDL